MNLYMSAYVSNESMHACLATLGLVLTAGALAEPVSGVRRLLLVGLVFGLALLTKITAVLLLGLACYFLAWKLLAVERRPVGEVLARVALVLGAAASVCGWYFAGNWARYGRPVVVNWDLPGFQWWQQPGFHTPAYFLTFGEALRHPYFSAFHSFGDGVYSTLWGDGLLGGLVSAEPRHPGWNLGFMSAGYLVALPAAVAMLGGWLALPVLAWRQKEAGRRLALLLLWAAVLCLGCALVCYSLLLAAYAAAKSFYALSLVAPLAVAAAVGLGAVDELLRRPRLLALRAVFYGWFGALVGVLYLSFLA
jgi:hypothetical protein